MLLLTSGPPVLRLAAIAMTAYIGYFGPEIVIDRRIEARQSSIRRALPDTLDLLTISVEAGLGFDAALSQVMHSVPGALSMEIARTMQEMQLGVSRADAFRNLNVRTEVDELKSLVLAIIQADKFGISVSKVLRAQAHEQRTKRRQRTEERAMKIPVKILFPLITCVLPSMFIVVLGPGVIRIVQQFMGLGM
jgi:tight adherence protein C